MKGKQCTRRRSQSLILHWSFALPPGPRLFVDPPISLSPLAPSELFCDHPGTTERPSGLSASSSNIQGCGEASQHFLTVNIFWIVAIPRDADADLLPYPRGELYILREKIGQYREDCSRRARIAPLCTRSGDARARTINFDRDFICRTIPNSSRAKCDSTARLGVFWMGKQQVPTRGTPPVLWRISTPVTRTTSGPPETVTR